MSSLQIIATLESITSLQSQVIDAMATRLAELGDTITGKDELAEADRMYRDAFGDENMLGL
jgi:uncharacterized coiled-coil protein SlyX